MITKNYLAIACVLLSLLLLGCESTNTQIQPQTDSVAVTQNKEMSPYQLNSRFLKEIEEHGVKGAVAFVNEEVFLNYFDLLSAQKQKGDGKLLIKGVLGNLSGLLQTGEFFYLGTEEQRNRIWRSYYRVISEDGRFLYFHLVWRQGRYLVDVKSESLAHSALEFMAIGHLTTEIEESQQIIFVQVMKSLEGEDIEQAVSQLKNLSDTAKSNEFVQHILMRTIFSVMPLEQTRPFVDELVKIIGEEKLTGLAWLDYHLRNKAYPKALDLLDSAPEYVRQDTFQMFQKGGIYAELKDYASVWQIIHDTLYFNGEDPANYILAAQLVIVMQEYQYAVEFFNILESKFDVVISKQALSEWKGGQSFIDSAAFKKWREST
ncbi:hypothetical protein [Pseudoalteromonas luteoviolacea]|uniref:hypothetical protein n=1 Tax=Pseudoalteromonas luteoviolacea TaxID=43657 RepID=UPI001150F0FE|nr:hypothetical protein [Pseudoalteromonas luteoviolacea]TQF67908.1 hypothetical protein FLM44_22275 [Pseudoalteromonas luteoviolacea]